MRLAFRKIWVVNSRADATMLAVRTGWPKLRAGICLAVLAGCAGCSGINATQSVSPLDFLLPGAGKLLHLQNTPPLTPQATNDCLAAVSSSEFPASLEPLQVQ